MTALLILATTCAVGQAADTGRVFDRIVSLYPAHTENLCRLGADGKIVGISASDDYPPRILDRPRFSYREDAEKVMAVRPDLVLVRPMIARGYAPWVEKLQRAGITVISMQPGTIREMFAYWQRLGELTGREEKAREMVAAFQSGVEKMEMKVATIPMAERKKVYFEAIHRKMKTFAPESMAIFCLQTAGGINAAPDADPVHGSNIAAYGKERILARGHEIDMFLAQQGRMNRVTKKEIMEEPGFTAINAVAAGQVFPVDEVLVSRPTMRLLEGIATIHTLLYGTGR